MDLRLATFKSHPVMPPGEPMVSPEQEASIGVEGTKTRQEELLFVTHRSKPHWETLLGLGDMGFRKCIGFFVRFPAIGWNKLKLFLFLATV